MFRPQRLVFLWLAVPWLQAELDLWVRRFNSSPRRADKHKLTPQGVPDLIAAHPEEFMARDYKVCRLVSTVQVTPSD